MIRYMPTTYIGYTLVDGKLYLVQRDGTWDDLTGQEFFSFSVLDHNLNLILDEAVECPVIDKPVMPDPYGYWANPYSEIIYAPWNERD